MNNNEIKGFVHSIDTGGMVDGPGIRYLVFLAGCMLRCKYCHNPDTWDIQSGKEMSVGEIVRDAAQYKSYMKYSGGGVTVSGGEPFGQPQFLEAFLTECKANGFHTAIDTSGFATGEIVKNILEYTDLVLLDVKSINPNTHRNVTGVPIFRVLNTLGLCENAGVSVWIRHVLVPGLTDNLDDIYKLAEHLKPLKCIEKIDVIPFHKTGEYKWRNLNIPYELTDTQPPSLELLNTVKGILEK